MSCLASVASCTPDDEEDTAQESASDSFPSLMASIAAVPAASAAAPVKIVAKTRNDDDDAVAFSALPFETKVAWSTSTRTPKIGEPDKAEDNASCAAAACGASRCKG